MFQLIGTPVKEEPKTSGNHSLSSYKLLKKDNIHRCVCTWVLAFFACSSVSSQRIGGRLFRGSVPSLVSCSRHMVLSNIINICPANFLYFFLSDRHLAKSFASLVLNTYHTELNDSRRSICLRKSLFPLHEFQAATTHSFIIREGA